MNNAGASGAAASVGPEVMAFLAACSAEYDRLAPFTEVLARRAGPEAALQWAECLIGFAGMHHPGRFDDGTVENPLLACARELPTPPESIGRALSTANGGAGSRRRVLHVATTLQGIGGHTRTMLHWAAKDAGSVHSVLVTAQGRIPLHPGVVEAIHASGGELVQLDSDAPLALRAAWLRRYAAERADMVFLHLSPADVVAVAAFAAPGVPVALVNLADQCYWLGNTVADVVVHLRDVGAGTSRELRSVRRHGLLPIPLSEASARLDRSAARAALGIPASQTVLLSVGRSLKYAPSRRHNFFATACRLLDRAPGAHLYLVGVRAEDHRRAAGFVEHPRMHLVGPVPDPAAYQCAADLYLEGFPFGSQTALLESVLPGVPCVLAHSQLTPLLATQDVALDGLVQSPSSEDAYIDAALALLDDYDRRRATGAALRERVLTHHVGPGWNEALESVYAALQGHAHAAQPIVARPAQQRLVDLAISEFHATRLHGTDLVVAAQAAAEQAVFSTAFQLRQRGRHADALAVLRIAASEYGPRRLYALEVAKIGAQWIARRRPPPASPA